MLDAIYRSVIDRLSTVDLSSSNLSTVGGRVPRAIGNTGVVVIVTQVDVMRRLCILEKNSTGDMS